MKRSSPPHNIEVSFEMIISVKTADDIIAFGELSQQKEL
jgi:hypothetical protein